MAVAFVYGSLIPFEVRTLSPEDALGSFARIRLLELGLAARADWVANGVVILPFGFFMAAAVRGLGRIGIVIAVPAAALALAVGVEFAQLWFVPRTVSLNDVLAEVVGGSVGAIIWLAVGPWLVGLATRARWTSRTGLRAGLVLYALAYLAVSVYPLDVVVSLAELESVLAKKAAMLWAMPGGDRSSLHTAAILAVAAVAAAPIGVLYALRDGRGWAGGLTVCTLLGIELMQLPVAGASISLPKLATALVGGVAGAQLPAVLDNADATRRLVALGGRGWPVAALLYGAALVHLNGLSRGGWTTLAQAWASIKEGAFIPFYFHYFTTEVAAVSSILFQAAMYAPVGVALGLAGAARAARAAGAVALLTAVAIETARQFKPDLRADPTNIIIACAAAAFAAAITRHLATALTAVPDQLVPGSDRSRSLAATVASVVAGELGGRAWPDEVGAPGDATTQVAFEAGALTGHVVLTPSHTSVRRLTRREVTRAGVETASAGLAPRVRKRRRRAAGRTVTELKAVIDLPGNGPGVIRVAGLRLDDATVAVTTASTLIDDALASAQARQLVEALIRKLTMGGPAASADQAPSRSSDAPA